MGDASDAVKEKAGQVGSEAIESAKNVAGKVADRAQSAAKEEGLSPSAVSDAARNLSEGIRKGQGARERLRADDGDGSAGRRRRSVEASGRDGSEGGGRRRRFGAPPVKPLG